MMQTFLLVNDVGNITLLALVGFVRRACYSFYGDMNYLLINMFALANSGGRKLNLEFVSGES